MILHTDNINNKVKSGLYIVSTPIGNLSDITLRALEVLKKSDYILCEDTRTSKNLLDRYEIKSKLISNHKFNEKKNLSKIIEILNSDCIVSLISDAGTPGISDPGFLLTRACIENNIEVECLPGATAFVPALVNSGLPNDKFVFEGFLPVKKGRQTRFLLLSEEKKTMIFYESPHKLLKTLTDFVTYFGEERQLSVSRELTKIFEETKRGTTKEVLEYFSKKPTKGEIVIVVDGKK